MAIYSVNYGGRGYPQNPRLLFGTRKTILEPFEPILQSTRYPHLWGKDRSFPPSPPPLGLQQNKSTNASWIITAQGSVPQYPAPSFAEKTLEETKLLFIILFFPCFLFPYEVQVSWVGLGLLLGGCFLIWSKLNEGLLSNPVSYPFYPAILGAGELSGPRIVVGRLTSGRGTVEARREWGPGRGELSWRMRVKPIYIVV